MNWYDQGMDWTKQHEGFRSNEYLDTEGIPTVGYGFNRQAHPEYPRSMNKKQADAYFAILYQESEKMAQDFAGKRWDDLTDSQKIVLTDMAYNLNKKLYGFEDMRKAVQAGDSAGTVREMIDSKWYNQVGNRGRDNVNLWKQ